MLYKYRWVEYEVSSESFWVGSILVAALEHFECETVTIL